MFDFHQRLHNLRYYDLNIKSKEAAARLGLSPQLYSHYEKGRSKFPADLLPRLKYSFGLSDEVFLELILGVPSKRKTASEITARSKEIQEAYLTTFAENYFELINDSEIRRLLSIILHSPPEVRMHQINEIRKVLDKSPTFNLKQRKKQKIQYKLNKGRTFTLVDGDSLPKLFLKTDDTAPDE